jgi:hypothetical protein
MNMPTLQPGPNRSPAGFIALGAFFLFGFVMASYAAITLGFPGTVLDRAWALNPTAHMQLARFGRWAALPFTALALALLAAGIGWFRRQRWAWLLGTAVISVNLLGDAGQLLFGEILKGAMGVVIAGLVLAAITRPNMRRYFGGSV